MIRSTLLLLATLLASAGPGVACSPAELIQKQKAYSDAVKAAFERDQAGDQARQARMQAVIDQYKDLRKSTNGPDIIDMLCKAVDDL
jgi:hypothetical protein